MYILGLSAFYHDSAAVLIEDGQIIAAAQEERFTRKKHDAAFPTNAVAYCLAQAGLDLDDIEHIAFFEKPFIKFERLLETYLALAPRGFSSFRMAMPVWIKDKLFQKTSLIKSLVPFSRSGKVTDKLLFADHHQSHAASAFFPSPFEEAIILTMDGVGEWTTSSVCIGRGNTLQKVREIKWPHSLGLLYSAFTYYTGFKVNSGEYKLMGLAPYGQPVYAELIKEKLINIKPDGSFWLDQSYFNYATGLTMTNAKFDLLFGGPARQPGDQLGQREMNLAASIQQVTQEVMLAITRELASSFDIPNLCLAGGVALNCVANGVIQRDGAFEQLWVQPAAGDAGGALGAALAACYLHKNKERRVEIGQDNMQGSYLGPAYDKKDIRQRLDTIGARYQELDDLQLYEQTVDALVAGKAVGWFDGRMEFGPRALGARSILADPRNTQMQKTLNLRIKYRESFRPFAPAVLAEDIGQWFELQGASPYMLLVDKVRGYTSTTPVEGETSPSMNKRLSTISSPLPAVTHVDGSARIQSVHKETNPRFHALISTFKKRTGCSVLINTSFNVRGEPIVCTPEEAFSCFMGCDMETLVCGNFILHKQQQDQSLAISYKDRFELD